MAVSNTAAGQAEISVLFIGNSLTYYNDMPEILKELAITAGKKISVASVTKGSSTMCRQASSATEIGVRVDGMLQNHWDYVVIQPSRRITPKEDSVRIAEFEAGKRLDSRIKKTGAETVIYCTWGSNTGSTGIFRMNDDKVNASADGSFAISQDGHSRFMQDICREYSDMLGADIVDCAELFRYLIKEHPEVNLYHTDNKHPSVYGSFAAACAFFAYFFGESAEEAAKSNTKGVEEDIAVMLAKAADRIVGKA